MASDHPDQLVQVLYALTDQQVIVCVDHEPGMTAAEAVEKSGLAERFPSIGDRPLVLGVWGVGVEAGYRLAPGDRVEISRPLVADPRDMRRELMSDGRVMGGARSLDQERGSSVRSRSIRET
jgi:putative ubiquitin-RnfH superfamily antitoxin RatB of RatAB toxin-antitoxin module